MDGSTVVIGPPDGNMNDYLDSLEHLLSYKVNFFAPGHGNFMHEPKKTIQSIIRHRLSRENKAIRKLKDFGENSLNDLVKHVYDDVSEQLHPIALYSLEAHLIKLMNEKKVEKNNNFYRLI
jgi:glyoxylase-like metal-dependent hydrolase (beta-lactamase superfamily II)